MKQKNLGFRAAFTLIELLVVIGIIAVLAGILLTVTGSGTESARAAKCIANLRSLAQAANAAAMGGGYPAAGSFQTIGVNGNQMAYTEVRGWISWLSNEGDPFGYKEGSAKPTAPVSVDIAVYDEQNEEKRLFAITNGSIWKATGKHIEIYRCPTHLKQGGSPNFSYVMNASFGYDYTKGTKGAGGGVGYGTLQRADRTLMFAEIGGGSDKYGRDCTLQYRASVNGKEYGANWDGTPESIGFMHKGSKGRMCAHVAFADGHTEKLLAPSGDGGLTKEQLTALLCAGKDLAFDGSKYEEIRETD